jgi:hypothetical protein
MPDPTAPPTHPLLERVLDPATPRTLKLAAARGTLPLPRQELIVALVHLSADQDIEVASESRKALDATPPELLEGMLQDPKTPLPILDHFGRDKSTARPLLQALILNPSCSDELLLQIADSTDPGVLDDLVGNETRLAAHPDIARRLKANPALSRDSRRRIAELEEHVLGNRAQEYVLPRQEAVPEVVPSLPGTLEGVAEEGAEGVPTPMLEIPLTPEEQAAEEALRNTPLFQRIVRMSVAEKIQAALKGNAEERSILIRDPSRLVASSVLKSPKLSEQEIESFANLRNVQEEVLRTIGNHREWAKAYSVAHALARNPRTPTGISLTMLNRLVIRDLKNLGIDKNIPEVIRRSAKRLYDLRTQPQNKVKRK